MSALQKSLIRGLQGKKFSLCQLLLSRHAPEGLHMNKYAMPLASSHLQPLLHTTMLQSSALTVPASIVIAVSC